MQTIKEKILKLKKERNAVIIAHNYQPIDVQEIADFLGDSLDLSRKAAQTSADVIVFCGVHFMAETAAILAPNKIVLIPDATAGCPMANMISAKELVEVKSQHPGAKVVCYVNTSAEIKALSDVCCTSSNAKTIVNSMLSDDIIFVPDKNLGHYTQKITGKKMFLWNGYCPTHVKFQPEHVLAQKKAHPNAKVLVHPECLPSVVELADQVLSTTGICEFISKSSDIEFIIGTETNILHRLSKENPNKKFYPLYDGATCPNMRKNSLEKVLFALEEMKTIVKVDPDVSNAAKKSLDKMLELSGK